MSDETRLTRNPTPYRESPDIETASAGYARRFGGPVGTYFLATQTRITLNLVSSWPGARVLDVGGGHAQIAVPLVHAGYDVTVVGSSEACRHILERALPAELFRFRTCDILALPFEDREFDIVVAFRLLAHVKRWQDLIGEMCRVARHAVVLDYPDLRSFNLVQQYFFGWKKAVEKNTRHFTCFTRKDLARTFARHGFQHASRRPQFFVPMALHRALGRLSLTRAAEGLSGALGLTRALGSPVILRMERGDGAAMSGPDS